MNNPGNLTVAQLQAEIVEIQAQLAIAKRTELEDKMAGLLAEANKIQIEAGQSIELYFDGVGFTVEITTPKVERGSTGPRDPSRPLATCFSICATDAQKLEYRTLKTNTLRWALKVKVWESVHSANDGHGYIGN